MLTPMVRARSALSRTLDLIADAIPAEMADACDQFTARAWLVLWVGGVALIGVALAVPA